MSGTTRGERAHTALLRALPIAVVVIVLPMCSDPGGPGGEVDEGGPLTDVVAIAAGGAHSCALSSTGHIWCWGGNESGQLGLGMFNSTPAALAMEISQSGVAFASVAGGNTHTCALDSDREIWCWGADDRRQLGYMDSIPLEQCGTTPCHTFPRIVIDGTRFGNFDAGSQHTCAGTPLGTLFCWGANHMGQVGSGGSTDVMQWAWPVTGGHLFSLVAAGGTHTCGRTTDGTTYCWGDNRRGQLGTGGACPHDLDYCVAPEPVSGGTSFVTMALGGDHTCGLTSDGVAYCWGAGTDGALGDGADVDRSAPVAVDTDVRFTKLTAGLRHTCGLAESGLAYCWGANGLGQLGVQSLAAGSSVPVAVAGSLVFQDLAAGAEHTCGVTTDQRAYCWGANEWGQLGDGTTQDRAIPDVVGREPK